MFDSLKLRLAKSKRRWIILIPSVFVFFRTDKICLCEIKSFDNHQFQPLINVIQIYI